MNKGKEERTYECRCKNGRIGRHKNDRQETCESNTAKNDQQWLRSESIYKKTYDKAHGNRAQARKKGVNHYGIVALAKSLLCVNWQEGPAHPRRK